jgi:transcriptional regulator with XRE-family HTH domain
MRYWEFEEDVDSAVSVGLRVIGDLVREARLRRNLTQRQLAWSALLAQSTISRLETGRLHGMRLRTLAAILGVLRTNPKGSASAGWCRAGHGFPEPSAPRRRLPRQTIAGAAYTGDAPTDAGDVPSYAADGHRPRSGWPSG